jgi:imidazolonepropionase
MKQKILVRKIGELVTFSTAEKKMIIYHDVEMLIEGGDVRTISTQISVPDAVEIDVAGCLLTPGFVDPHTHPVFFDTRELEFEMRIQGKSYLEIAAAGGGIRSSVRSLRMADRSELKQRVRRRLDDFLKLGTTTIEAKSGYGLSVESELETLRILKELTAEHPLDIRATFLGAHEYPDEYRDRHQDYIDLIVGEMLPTVVREKLAEFCDIFCEDGVFSVTESRQVMEAAKTLGLGLRIHADEFKSIGGVELAARLKAVSADHLTTITEHGILALKESGVIPVLLPATTFFLGSDYYAPGRKMWDAGLPVALATDFNPGSSMTQSMPLVISLACLKMHLSPLEALQAATIHAARSLKLDQRVGSLEPGKQADFIIWDFKHYQGIPYNLAQPVIRQVWKKGVPV